MTSGRRRSPSDTPRPGFAALLIVVIIVGAGIMNAPDAKQSYDDCMAARGFAMDQPADVGADGVAAYREKLAAATSACGGEPN